MQSVDTPFTLLTDQIRFLRTQLDGAVDGRADEIHDARVATRRIRELLPLTLGKAPHAVAGDLPRFFREVGRALGRVRDSDVSLELVSRLRHRLSAAAPARVLVQQRHERAREKMMRRLIKSFEKLEVRDTLDALKGKRATPSWFGPRWRSQLRESIVARASSATDAIEHATRVYFPNRTHEARIAIKKLRYSLEIAQATRESDEEDALRDLKRTQTLLGEIHDCQTLTDELDKMTDHARRVYADQLAMVTDLLEGDRRDLYRRYLARRDRVLELCRIRGRASGTHRRSALPYVVGGTLALSSALYLTRQRWSANPAHQA